MDGKFPAYDPVAEQRAWLSIYVLTGVSFVGGIVFSIWPWVR